MDSGQDSPTSQWKLWHYRNGISFAPSPAAGRQPLYPNLDMSRFLHGATSGSVESQPPVVANAPQTHSTKLSSTRVPIEPTSAGGEPAPDTEAQVETSAKEEPKEEEEDDDPGDPPITDLEFNIPEDVFRAARLAEPGTPDSFWSYTLYRGPEEDGDGGPKVKVHYCKSLETTERVCQYFLEEKVIGFDLEWVPNATKSSGERKNCSLVQLASASRIALFHISMFPPKSTNFVAPSFKKIMEDPDITKVGVAIKSDCTRLKTYLGVQTMGQFELSHLYKQVKYHKSGEVQHINKRLVALAKQVQDHLRLPMFKGQDVRASDWSRALSLDQIVYAASDAYAAVQLYAILEKQREALDPVPPRPQHAELGLPIRLAPGVTLPVAEETAEEIEEEVDEGDRTAATLSPDFVASATDSIEVEMEADEPVAPKPATPRKPPTASKKPKDERYLAAEAWLAQYRSSHQRIRAAPSALRTYHIWHSNEELDPVAIAKLLRDPPLQTNTVVSYILETIKMEKLPYNKARLSTEVLALLPEQILEMRYKSLAKACGYSANDATKSTA